MTANVDVVNRALQIIGTRTTITATQLANSSNNEAKQANLVLTELRDQLLRMAPWDCGLNTANLVYITSVPGTPENTSLPTTLWAKGQPPPPWAYEYQYPVDCLRACWVIPAMQTGTQGGVPIYPVATGGAAGFWTGPPVKYKVQIDQFYPVTAAVIAAGGTGYAIGDVITLASGAAGSAPIGAPVKLQVATVAAGVILTVTVVNQIINSATPQGGSYFTTQTNPVAQGSVAGVGGGTSSGSGATFTLTFGAQSSQRVILCNQEFASLAYVKQITDPNLMDPMFIEAWASILGAHLVIALTGDKGIANMAVAKTNNAIMEARKADGNEGLTINDVTPDWIRIRGIAYDEGYTSPFGSFDWGPTFSSF